MPIVIICMCVVGLLVPHAAQGEAEGRGPTRDGRGGAAPRARRHDTPRARAREGALAMYVTYTYYNAKDTRLKSLYINITTGGSGPPRVTTAHQTLKHVKNCTAVAGATAGRVLALHRCSTVPGAPEAEHAP